VRDGGEPVRDRIEDFLHIHHNHPKAINFIDRDENRGLAASYNEAYKYVRGKYVCYLADDDKYYPNHVAELVKALEACPQFKAAYSDLYKTFYNQDDGRRVPILKDLCSCRDYDRFFIRKANHILGMALMHHRDLMFPINENLTCYVDWAIAKKISYFTDFLHVLSITGEYFCNIDTTQSDRISDVRNVDEAKVTMDRLAIISEIPPDPDPRYIDAPDFSLFDNSVKRAAVLHEQRKYEEAAEILLAMPKLVNNELWCLRNAADMLIKAHSEKNKCNEQALKILSKINEIRPIIYTLRRQADCLRQGNRWDLADAFDMAARSAFLYDPVK
jgi:glycosyltransferase involved in cell wall biosynthesis